MDAENQLFLEEVKEDCLRILHLAGSMLLVGMVIPVIYIYMHIYISAYAHTCACSLFGYIPVHTRFGHMNCNWQEPDEFCHWAADSNPLEQGLQGNLRVFPSSKSLEHGRSTWVKLLRTQVQMIRLNISIGFWTWQRQYWSGWIL